VRARLPVFLLLGATLLTAACSNSPDGPVTPTVDLTGYFLLPDSGFTKFFKDINADTTFAQTYVDTTTVNGFAVVDVLRGQDLHEYFRRSDRAWVGTLRVSDSALILLEPPLAAIPDRLALGVDVVATAQTLADPAPFPVTRTSRLVDTGLTITVPAGTFTGVAKIRQTFQRPGPPPAVLTDSTYRWYAKGVDEIQRVLWEDGKADSTLIEFIGGKIDSLTFP
jgi:hypothetical protein